MMRRAMLRAQLRGHKELADKMRAHGIDETVAFHEERKGLLEEKYHYRDYTGDKDPRFDKRLDVYQQIYEEQEMDGGCRYMMQKEQEAAEDKIYKMAVRRGEPIGPEEHVRIAARIEEAKARVLRRYKGIDADLRSGDPYCEQKAKEYLQHVAVDGAQHKWDYARAAHKRYQASLLGTQEDERRVKADNEMEGRPDADGETLAAFDNVGFMEQDEFDMLRREVGEEIADEYVVNIQKAREEVARKRLQHVSDRKKLNQLEKKMVLQEYKTVFENGYKEHRRRDGAAQNLSESLARTKEYEDFENEHSLSGEHDLNRQSHEMMASMRQKRAEVIKNRNKGKPMPEVNAYWEATAGSVQNPTRGFVDPDWWELATDDPRLKRHYREAMRQDARQVRKETDAVTLRKQAGDDVLAAMESFNDHRKDTFSRGYSKSQVLAYDDPETNEPRNKHIEDFLGTSVATGLPREREFTRESLLRWEYEVAAARRNSSGKRGTELPEN
eukprot:TRINITY_DN33689_c0_g1_i1.p1 TRINITY_DN33689_c0_g1~~TRINITY_DN33689_c0_g1_i1.p1  ORF type:complete len:498 (+),score=156.16 TRINITY_DN33689_c0_g1_i1:31-1524(+)